MGKLDGKVAVVAGGGRNIGEGVSLLLASEGAKVAIFDMDPGRGTRVVAEIKERGGEAVSIVGDVSKSADVQNMVKQAVKQWGHIDILANCAAISDRQTILDLPDETWQQVLDVTLTGTYLCCKYVAKQMVTQGRGGAIVNFTSGSAFRGSTGRISYDAAKGGVVALTQSAAVQLAPHKIRVNAIAPGMTGFQVGGAIPPDKRPYKNLLGRITMPADQAKVVLFLVSDDSEHIVGSTIHVDGGSHIM
jgi:glucose 1-dehydrogenase